MCGEQKGSQSSKYYSNTLFHSAPIDFAKEHRTSLDESSIGVGVAANIVSCSAGVVQLHSPGFLRPH